MENHNNNQQNNEIESLPFRKIFKITCKGLKIRLFRSLIVVSGIILAIAFLSYILCADAFLQNLIQSAPEKLLENLRGEGLNLDNSPDQRIQTYWMVGLALMISFVGIVNAMLMSVTERFREIGTMKCLGALDSFVMKMFLIESAIEGAAGTAVGLIIGLALAYTEGLSIYGVITWSLVPVSQLLLIILSSFVAGIFITVVGALYPAWQAAKMMPVVALRAEL